jgi:hypothetical protein
MDYKQKRIIKLICSIIKSKGPLLLRQITFTTGRIRWGWTPPQFQNTFINL